MQNKSAGEDELRRMIDGSNERKGSNRLYKWIEKGVDLLNNDLYDDCLRWLVRGNAYVSPGPLVDSCIYGLP